MHSLGEVYVFSRSLGVFSAPTTTFIVDDDYIVVSSIVVGPDLQVGLYGLRVNRPRGALSISALGQ